MNKPAALLAVGGLILLGVVSGMFGAHLFYAHQLEDRELAPRRGPGAFMSHLEEQLDLSPDQRQQLERIMRESHAEADALRRELLPRVEEHMERTRERILAILTPEQREDFERLHRLHRHRAERFFLGPPPGRGPHGHGRRGNGSR